ncbi:unnamed protein product [Caenorhabditis angaria]|uniref:Uncharacterized protein n=1 Tax=Caenorhabditis angaria TaxID=860376 RepID=A0A9P1IJA3_9PELO|nr:unnamed protein product [Caenorhabditis angaria]
MSKTRKSRQDNSSKSSSGQVSLFPTAQSPSLLTATDSADPHSVPTAMSRSTKTGIGANTSDFERVPGMSDTSAGSSQQNSKIEAMTAKSATSPQILLNDLRRGQLFGKQSQSQSQQSDFEDQNNQPNIKASTFSEFPSTASELSETEEGNSIAEKSTQPEKTQNLSSSKKSKGSRIISILERKKQERSRAKEIRKSSKMSGSSKKTKKAKNFDESSKRITNRPVGISKCSDAATSNSSFSKSKKSMKKKNIGEESIGSHELPEVAGIKTAPRSISRKPKTNVDESVRMSSFNPPTGGLVDLSKRSRGATNPPLPQQIQSNRYPLIPGQSPSNTSLPAKVTETFAPGPLPQQSIQYPNHQQPSKRGPKVNKPYNFPGNGRSLKTVIPPPPPQEAQEKVARPHESTVYDISNLNNSQRRVPPKSLFGAGAVAPPRSNLQQRSTKIQPKPAGNSVVIYGTTADGKNQVEFTIQMRIVSGDAVQANQNKPVDVLPKKIVLAGKEISVEKPGKNEDSMNL